MFYVFSRIYYVSRGPHGRMAILAKCVTLLKYCIGVGRFRILGWGAMFIILGGGGGKGARIPSKT